MAVRMTRQLSLISSASPLSKDQDMESSGDSKARAPSTDMAADARDADADVVVVMLFPEAAADRMLTWMRAKTGRLACPSMSELLPLRSQVILTAKIMPERQRQVSQT